MFSPICVAIICMGLGLPPYAVNIFYYHGLIKTLLLCFGLLQGRIESGRKSKQRYRRRVESGADASESPEQQDVLENR